MKDYFSSIKEQREAKKLEREAKKKSDKQARLEDSIIQDLPQYEQIFSHLIKEEHVTLEDIKTWLRNVKTNPDSNESWNSHPVNVADRKSHNYNRHKVHGI